MHAFQMLSKGDIPVTIPVMVVHGENDEMVNERDSRRLFERLETREKELFVAEGGTHAIVIDIGDTIIDKVASFIRKYDV